MLQKNQILKSKDGGYYKMILRCDHENELYDLSCSWNENYTENQIEKYKKSYGSIYTKYELEKDFDLPKEKDTFQDGEMYYFISSGGNICNTNYYDDNMDVSQL